MLTSAPCKQRPVLGADAFAGVLSVASAAAKAVAAALANRSSAPACLVDSSTRDFPFPNRNMSGQAIRAVPAPARRSKLQLPELELYTFTPSALLNTNTP
jgi:hypothetical protein